MDFCPWIIWFLAAGILVGQIGNGVILIGPRMWFRRTEKAVGFWLIIAIQSGMLLLVGIIWMIVIRADSSR
jgi:hypothetical protein